VPSLEGKLELGETAFATSVLLCGTISMKDNGREGEGEPLEGRRSRERAGRANETRLNSGIQQVVDRSRGELTSMGGKKNKRWEIGRKL